MKKSLDPIHVKVNKNDPRHFTPVVTRPPKPPLRTPFDDLLLRIQSPRQWQAKRAKVLAAFRSTLGEFPRERVKLEARIVRTEKLKEFERHKVEIRVHTAEWMTAYLCVPRRPLARHPGALCLPYTHARTHEIIAGLDGMIPEAYGARLARAGFVTLCPNHFVQGEREPRDGPFVTRDFYRKYPKWSAVGKAIWDNRRCMDFLASLQFVNAKRIGCMGHSLGAHSAVFLAAMDERVKCVVSNCGISSLRCNPNRCQWSRDGWYIYLPTLRALFLKGELPKWDMHELGASLAPRPWLDISSLNDPTFDGAEHLPGMFVRVSEAYKFLGAAEKLAFCTHGAQHGMFEYSYALAEAWLKRWLE